MIVCQDPGSHACRVSFAEGIRCLAKFESAQAVDHVEIGEDAIVVVRIAFVVRTEVNGADGDNPGRIGRRKRADILDRKSVV